MRILKANFYYLLILTIVLSSCKKFTQGDSGNAMAIVPGSVPYVQASGVYISGYTALHDSIYAANVWKDGATFSLPATNGYTTAITCSGNDVYVAGGSGRDVGYWKNGLMTTLTTAPSGTSISATGIAVQGNDVYVSGLIYTPNAPTKPVYWKNGVLNYLPYNPQTLTGVGTRFIAICGQDVYIGGDGFYWKNGVITNLPNAQSVTAIAISGTDVYILGQASALSGSSAMAYWKNGVQTYIPYNKNYPITQTSAIAVHGNDIYVVGNASNNSTDYAVYWKGGVLTPLDAGGSSLACATAVTIDAGNNVYISGVLRNSAGLYNAVYWKNGTLNTLSTLNSGTTGIVYVP
jgi:hypothetical protein